MPPSTQDTRGTDDEGLVVAKFRAIRQLLADVERVLQPRYVEPTASYISKTPGVCGGDACVRKTRIPVWLLISLRRLGRAEDELLDDYPGLRAADLDAAWAYYRDNPAEIDEAIVSQDRGD